MVNDKSFQILTKTRDTMKLFSFYVDNTTVKSNCQDVAFRLQQMIFKRLEDIEKLSLEVSE